MNFDWKSEVDLIRDNFSILINKYNNVDSIEISTIEKIYDNLSLYVDKNVLPQCLKISSKDAEVSRNSRLQGNKRFSEDEFQKSIESYYKALLHAPKDSKSLVLAYGNISANLFHQKKFKQSIFYIDLALKSSDSEEYCVDWRDKLKRRKHQCLIELRKCTNDRLSSIYFLKNGTSESNEDPLKNHEYRELEESENCDKFKIEIDSFTSKVRCHIYPKKGRGLVAVETIEPGETIIAERPYVKVLLKPFELLYCHFCLRCLSHVRLPCIECTNVFYCSSKCRQEAWTVFHEYECKFLPFLHEFGIGHLALRIFLIADWSEILDCNKNLDLNANVRADSNQFDLMKMQCDYRSLHSLIDNISDADFETFQSFLITSIMIAVLLEKMECLIKRYSGLKISTIQLIKTGLYNLFRIVSNASSISDLHSEVNSQNSSNILDCRVIAAAIYPSISLLNHNCNPNIVSLFKAGCINLIKAAKRIEPGEEIFNCYGIHFSDYNLEERQQMLQSQYRFRCECEVCCEEKDLQLKYPNLDSKASFIAHLSENLSEISAKSLEKIGSKLIQWNSEEICLRFKLRLSEIFDQISNVFYQTFGNVQRARFYRQFCADLKSKIYGDFSVQFLLETIKLCDLIFESYKTSKCSKNEMLSFIKKSVSSLEVLINYSDSYNLIDLDEVPDYFETEIQRLNQRLNTV